MKRVKRLLLLPALAAALSIPAPAQCVMCYLSAKSQNAARARVLEAAHHVHDVERLAVAGVAIDQQRQSGRAGDLADEEAHLVHRDHADVGDAHRRGHRRTGQVQRLETGRLRLERRDAVETET